MHATFEFESTGRDEPPRANKGGADNCLHE
jgi:hypothetical protein